MPDKRDAIKVALQVMNGFEWLVDVVFCAHVNWLERNVLRVVESFNCYCQSIASGFLKFQPFITQALMVPEVL